ncbi:MAG TPA: DMT family transporter [Burkholderiaceae bacterium]|nr:DMT family transporter [Burkholderiaceae bacterium]
MRPSDFAKLLLLAAIWGGSFIFMRIAVPEVGPMLTATLRVGLATIALIGFAGATGVRMEWRRNLKPYALVGMTAAALPFSCFTYAAQHLPVAYSALLNSTAPLFGALLSIFWLAERLSLRKAGGLALGIAGVAILMGAGALAGNASTLLAAAACLAAAASYAVSSIIVKLLSREAGHRPLEPLALTTGSMAWGTLLLLPTVPFSLPDLAPSTLAWVCVAALALLSSALAQAIFIPLIMRIGPTRAMSVSFLIPLFSMLWGVVFLQETLHLSMLIGAAIVLLAMALVLPTSLIKTAGRRV